MNGYLRPRSPLCDANGRQYPDANVAVEVAMADGRRDLLVAADAENPRKLKPSPADEGAALVQRDWGLHFQGELCLACKDKAGKIERLALCKARSLGIGGLHVELNGVPEYVELAFGKEGWRVVSGPRDAVREVAGW